MQDPVIILRFKCITKIFLRFFKLQFSKIYENLVTTFNEGMRSEKTTGIKTANYSNP